MQEYSPPPAPVPPRPAPPPRTFPFALTILFILLIVWILPSFVERLQYSWARGRERAEVEIARGELEKHPLAEISQAFTQVAKVIAPSVVHIDTTQQFTGFSRGDGVLFGQPRLYEAKGQGSGVIVDKEGYIITNHHVIENANNIDVRLSDGDTREGRLIGTDPGTDVAVVKIEADGLIAAEWGDSEKLSAGALVWAVGNPYGLDRSVSFGIISAIGRHGLSSRYQQDLIQTDAAVNPGNSGGPLVNYDAKVVGINFAIIGTTYQGIGFAIPSSTARDVYEKLRQNGKVVRGWLGVALDDVTPDVAKQLRLKDTKGAIVVEILANSPAEKAGIQVGDVIVKWNDQPVENRSTLPLMVARTEVGSKAKVVVIREGKEMTLDVLVEPRPAEK